MRKWIVSAAVATLFMVTGPSISKAQVYTQATIVTQPTYGYGYAPVYNTVPAYSYSSYPAYGGISIGVSGYPSYGYRPYYGGYGVGYGSRYYGGYGGYRGGYYGGFHGWRR
ncbi:hypothetical protein [Zavarzinella formosa]|uniref:hypothetical protein n=1 Tax=Zavarzinella formosa TaxID=360055 RepID=UPI000319F0C6|nr:hypothetical protein [Zavarzinella formosa]